MPTSVPTTGKLRGDAGSGAGLAQQRRQPAGAGGELDVHVVARARSSAASPAAVASGLPASVPAWNTGPSGDSVSMISSAPADGADRQAAADDLAERGQVGRHVVLRLGAAATEPEAGDHLVEDQQRTDAVALGAQALQEARLPGRRRPCWRRPARR